GRRARRRPAAMGLVRPFWGARRPHASGGLVSGCAPTDTRPGRAWSGTGRNEGGRGRVSGAGPVRLGGPTHFEETDDVQGTSAVHATGVRPARAGRRGAVARLARRRVRRPHR